MRALALLLIAVLVLWVVVPRLLPLLPPGYHPMAPLEVTDPPTVVTRFKLNALAADPSACLLALQRADTAGYISYSLVNDTIGDCPLVSAVRVRRFGQVRLSSSFLASCPLALRSAMFVGQIAAPLAVKELGSPLARIDHLGSYACRNIYNRAQGRLSEHASADALDVAAFTLADGRRIAILPQWPQQDAAGQYLHGVLAGSCGFFGNALGPDYNDAHANHFHLGMRGFNLCR
ncbi:extensin family protein [Acerihabitans sp. TG2]|uniref:extensin-like domain-containing protein n=1 Tax=Acerihabitans sp. TG2 TaxID=3096008 RepID=UPI002B223876|nr:extensin family protein [Acerihabitans sp. TG2]MEA9390752.1 extensin family protein [Acerihabitans sp. TG2]